MFTNVFYRERWKDIRLSSNQLILILHNEMGDQFDDQRKMDFGDLKKKKKKTTTTKYSHTFGDVHPGFHIGHDNCAYFKPGLPVPARMGWLWDAYDISGIKPRPGWQPGEIGKTIAQMMNFKCPRSEVKKGKEKSKKRKGGRPESIVDSGHEEAIEPKPTLKVQRKGDVIMIQVNPLKDLKEITPPEDPYIDCEPLVLKIIKKRSPEEQAKVEASKLVKLKKMRDAQIKKELAEAAEDICKCAYMDVYCNDLTAIDRVIESCPAFQEPECICREESLSSTSSNATWDIEYTPPFGSFDLSPKTDKTFIHVATQYIAADAGIVDTPRFKNKKVHNTANTKKPVKKSDRGSSFL